MLIFLTSYQVFPGTQNAGECTILLVILKKNPGVKPPAPLWAARKRVAFRACGPQRVTICGGPPLWKMARSAPVLTFVLYGLFNHGVYSGPKVKFVTNLWPICDLTYGLFAMNPSDKANDNHQTKYLLFSLENVRVSATGGATTLRWSGEH